jgi:hypothetical protein
MLESH